MIKLPVLQEYPVYLKGDPAVECEDWPEYFKSLDESKIKVVGENPVKVFVRPLKTRERIAFIGKSKPDMTYADYMELNIEQVKLCCVRIENLFVGEQPLALSESDDFINLIGDDNLLGLSVAIGVVSQSPLACGGLNATKQ